MTTGRINQGAAVTLSAIRTRLSAGNADGRSLRLTDGPRANVTYNTVARPIGPCD